MRLSVLFAAFALSACATVPNAQPLPAQQLVSDYTEAYNSQSLDGMSALAHPEIEWLNVEGSEVSSAAKGKADLIAQMGEYFSSP